MEKREFKRGSGQNLLLREVFLMLLNSLGQVNKGLGPTLSGARRNKPPNI